MQPQRLGTRAGMGPACLGCRSPDPSISDPIEKLDQRTFYFYFKNLRFASGRNDTFLCYKVTRVVCGLPEPLLQGVFRKEGTLHAELCFLYWFHNQRLEMSPGEKYKITWYVSWSPCSDCAEKVATFLATHRNLSLAIFSSRLYYFWKPDYQENLRRLTQEGAQMAAMSFLEFKKCWSEFVYNDNQPFRPWKKLARNFSFQDEKLQEILRLREEVFYVQFGNSQKVKPVQHRYCRRKTYLCYWLGGPSGQQILSRYLRNKKGKHAEILFIDELRAMELRQVRITCYITWSPCPECAQELAAFKRDRPDLVLRLYTSRLYFHWMRQYQKGLCSLWRSGIQLEVMDLPQFSDCWTNFVNSQNPFRPWDGLRENSARIQRRLRRIKESWGLQGLTNDFENLQL